MSVSINLVNKMNIFIIIYFLQINGVRTRDFDCCLAIPLITEAKNALEMIVCRNPIANSSNVDSSQIYSKPVRDYHSCDEGGSVYMNVPCKSGLNTPKSV